MPAPAPTRTRAPHLAATMRRGESVTPLELFFDLIFVLALTQATAIMAHEPTWAGIAKGLLVLGIMWWTWVGYAWLTSVIDPEEGAVRLVFAGAIGALLICSLGMPRAFEDGALLFAGAFAVVRVAHIALFWIASREVPELRRSVVGLAASTTLGVGLVIAGAFADGWAQGALWLLALALDGGGPFLFGAEGWKLSPRHFAERHGLIIIIALGESIVAIGAGVAGVDLTTGVVVAAILGVVVAFAMWWLYFDVVALVAERKLSEAPAGRVQNEMARDSYSYLHFPMMAGIVLVALGLKKVVGHVDEPLKLVPAAALFGGVAVYLFAHVAFRWRNIRTFNRHRAFVGVVALALIPAAITLPALATLGIAAALLSLLIAYEVVRFGEVRARIRREIEHG